jgi:hypothetical protein
MAKIVSRVTEPVLGVTFVPAAVGDVAIGPTWKTAALPIDGSTPLTVAVSADEACARILGSGMFATPEGSLDEEMMADALCELVNMTAGLLKSALHVDQPLGLPSMRQTELLSKGDDAWSQHYMRAGELNLILAVATRIC